MFLKSVLYSKKMYSNNKKSQSYETAISIHVLSTAIIYLSVSPIY